MLRSCASDYMLKDSHVLLVSQKIGKCKETSLAFADEYIIRAVSVRLLLKTVKSVYINLSWINLKFRKEEEIIFYNSGG